MHYVYAVNGLDCPMCAMTLENRIKEILEAATMVRVNHRQHRIELELEPLMSEDELLSLIIECVKVCDGNVTVNKIV